MLITGRDYVFNKKKAQAWLVKWWHATLNLTPTLIPDICYQSDSLIDFSRLILILLNLERRRSVTCDYVCVLDFTEEVVNRKRRSFSLREEGETTFVAQMTVFDKNRWKSHICTIFQTHRKVCSVLWVAETRNEKMLCVVLCGQTSAVVRRRVWGVNARDGGVPGQ